MKFQTVRGTRDILQEEQRRFNFITDTARTISELYRYSHISTPIFELTNVFERTLGESSDVVSKEMYSFMDRNDQSLTLRPEGTAGITRAVISNGLEQNLPLRYFYEGPMFRYERPQKGRYRQFHQIGVECIGISKPNADIEVIALASQVISSLGLKKGITLELNSLGDLESRNNFKKSLVEYLKKHQTDLSEESQKRLFKNPLRILDSKNIVDKEILKKAPIYPEYLNNNSKIFFQEVCAGLDMLNISYELNPRLVRGFDYYCHTAFEFTSTGLGSQNAILAGGRYDDLSRILGGKNIAGVGWASGIERLSLLEIDLPEQTKPIAVMPVGKESEKFVYKKVFELRNLGFPVDIVFQGSLNKRMKHANKVGACLALIIGEDEVKNNSSTVKNLFSGEQIEVSFDKLPEYLKSFFIDR